MTQKTDQGRRRALKKIAAGMGGLAAYTMVPQRWSVPIVGQVVLPAHAGTSGGTMQDCSVSISSGDQSSGSVTVQVNGALSPPLSGETVQVTAKATGGAGSSASGSAVTNAKGKYSTSLTVGGGPGITSVSVTASAKGTAGTATCSASVGQALPVLNQCTLQLVSGTQSSPTITVELTGSVSPPQPISNYTAVLTTTGVVTSSTANFQNQSGTYSIQFVRGNGPGYTGVTVTVTSPYATGSTSCHADVPPDDPPPADVPPDDPLRPPR